MDDALYSKVIVKYNKLPSKCRGSISLFRLIVNCMVISSQEASRHLLCFIKDLNIQKYPGKDV